jgi:hypothetical protein
MYRRKTKKRLLVHNQSEKFLMSNALGLIDHLIYCEEKRRVEIRRKVQKDAELTEAFQRIKQSRKRIDPVFDDPEGNYNNTNSFRIEPKSLILL